MTSYLPAMLISLLAHALIVLLVFVGWEYTTPPKPVKPPTYIKATLIDLDAKGKQGAPKQKPKPKKIELEKKRKELEKKKLDQKKKAEEKARKTKLAKQKAEKEKARKEKAQKEKQQKIAKEKKLAEEKRLAEKRKEQKRKEEQRKQEQKELQERARQEREKLERQRLEENLAKERERLEAERKAEQLAQQVAEDNILSQSYQQIIRQRVEQSWSRPPSARNGMEAQLRIQLVPTGEVVDVAVIKSSGSSEFDRSAVQAVKKVGQFSEIKKMPSRIFEREYRQFVFQFKPQDLRQ